MRSSLLASADVIEFHTTEAYFGWDLTEGKCRTYENSREEELKL
jgi:hypothetical protein